MKQCPKCGANCADTDTYCGVCGTPLPMWGEPVPTRSNDGFAVASMVLGILSICSAWFILGIVPAILAIIFGLLVLCSARRRQNGRGMAIAGLVTGGVGVIVSVIILLLVITIGSTLLSAWTDDYSDNGDPGFSQSDGFAQPDSNFA